MKVVIVIFLLVCIAALRFMAQNAKGRLEAFLYAFSCFGLCIVFLCELWVWAHA